MGRRGQVLKESQRKKSAPQPEQGVALSDSDMAFLDGLFDPFDNLTDAAYQAACESAVASCGRFDGRDPYDVWLTWATGNA